MYKVAAEPTPPLMAEPSEYIRVWKRVARRLAAEMASSRLSGMAVVKAGLKLGRLPVGSIFSDLEGDILV